MEWFKGNVTEAIQQAKTNRAVFIVCISGDDDASRAMLQSWNEPDVCRLSLSNSCVAIHLEATSQAGRQFAQIYPVMCVPSVFFINASDGIPLEVCGGVQQPSQLVDRLTLALQLHGSQTSPAATPTADSPSTANPNTANIPSANGSEAVVPQSASNLSSELDEGKGGEEGKAGSAENGATGGNPSEGPSESFEEKAKRAAALLAETRAQKAVREKEEEHRQELERRRLGQELGKFKDWKADMERKETEAAIRKEKEEAKRAREKVREDLERDRQERAQRFHKEKAEEQTVQQVKVEAKNAAVTEAAVARNAERRENARIQFRLPDGSSVTQTFAAADPLRVARDFIQQRLGTGAVMLVCTFPKRTYTDADMSSTFLDHELVPSAALIVLLAGRSAPSSVATSSDRGFVAYILAGLMAIWLFFVSFFSPPRPPPPAPSPGAAPSASGGASAAQPSGAESDPNRVRRRQKQPGGGGKSQLRAEGNIHRMNFNDGDSSSDDENATYNGNSTQQM